jgi:hypothetical protein
MRPTFGISKNHQNGRAITLDPVMSLEFTGVCKIAGVLRRAVATITPEPNMSQNKNGNP